MDIIGFDDQIGATIFELANRAIKNVKTAPLPKTANKGFFSSASKTVKKPIPVSTKSLVFSNVLKNAKSTGNPVIVKTNTGFKKLTPKTPVKENPFNLVPTATKKAVPALIKSDVMPVIPATAMPATAVKSEVSKFEDTLKNLPTGQEAKKLFNLPATSPIIEDLTPIQRSFTKTDLPFRKVNKNNSGQPTTKFIKDTPLKFNIDIDQIQPPVDSGVKDYYGK